MIYPFKIDENKTFAKWRHISTKTRILQGFAFLCKLELLLFKLRWGYQIQIWKEKQLAYYDMSL